MTSTTPEDPVLAMLDEWQLARDAGAPRAPEEIWARHVEWHHLQPSPWPQFVAKVALLLKAEGMGLHGNASLAPPIPVEQMPAPALGPAITHFRDLKHVDHGGLGVVYSAMHDESGRRVAIKVPRPDKIMLRETEERFRQEAVLTARLDHPGIVAVLGQGCTGDGRPYYAMQLVEGRSLQDCIEEHFQDFPVGAKSVDQSLRFRQLVGYMVMVCNTVAYAHEQGVLHRDLKPANIRIGTFERVHVLDWGLAKSRDAGNQGDDGVTGPTPPGHTTPGRAMGTVSFASPEQAAGDTDAIDHRSDVYGLGATLYCILTGKPPFGEESHSKTKRRVLSGDFPRPRSVNPSVDRALERICLVAMALRREDRYAAVAKLGDDLRRWLADELISVEKDNWLRWTVRWRRRNRAVARVIDGGLVVATVAVIALATVWGEYSRKAETRQRVEALLRDGDAKLLAHQYDGARADYVAAQRLSSTETDLEELVQRVRGATDRLGVHWRGREFLRRAEEVEFQIMGSYWKLLPSEETPDRRAIHYPGERLGDLATGEAGARQALLDLGIGPVQDPFSELAKAQVPAPEVAKVRRRAAEITFLAGIAHERLGQAEPEPAQVVCRQQALADLDAAKSLGMRDRVVDWFRAEILERSGAADEAKTIRETLNQRPYESILDFQFAAVEHARGLRWEESIEAYLVSGVMQSKNYWTFYRTAKALERAGRPKHAEAVFRACLRLVPGDATSQNSLGSLLSDQKRYAEAVVELEAVIRHNPDYLMAYTNLMLAHAELRDLNSVLAVHQQLLARPIDKHTEAIAWENLGIVHERLGDNAMALANYDKAVVADPQSKSAKRNRAVALTKLRRYEDAEAELASAIALAPRDGELRYLLGNVFAENEQLARAVSEYTAALSLAPGFVAARHNRALMLSKLDRFEEAILDHRAVLQAEPAHATALPDIGSLYARMARTQREPLRRRTLLRAQAVYLELLDKEPRNVEVLLDAGQIHGDLGQFVEGHGPDADLRRSEDLLSRAIELQPADARNFRARGVTRLRAQEWRGAIDDWQEYLRLKPDAQDRDGILNDSSNAWLGLGDAARAVDALDSIDGRLHDSRYLGNLGNARLQAGDLIAAIAAVEQAIAEGKPDDPDARPWALRGLARLRQGRFAEAADDFDVALEIVPGFYETICLAATARLGAGDDGAKEMFEQVARERPGHPRGRYARGRLALLDGRYPEAIQELTGCLTDATLRPFALAARAEAWLQLGTGGLAAAAADAEALHAALPRDAFARLQAARILAQAAQRAETQVGDEWRRRALVFVEQAVAEQPDLRATVAADASLQRLGADGPGTGTRR
ncbi:MAG: tetratricopeptide repeat protein [Planctomycetes bacterium]|nr:tetratricopeptide repeat protein [Planctomycetota bacterium]